MTVALIVIIFIVGLIFLEHYFKQFLRKRNFTDYPLFSQEEIELQKELAEESAEKTRKLWDTMNKIFEYESKKKKIEKNSDFSKETKNKMREHLLEEILSIYNKRMLNFKIEANLAIRNGKRIDEVEREYQQFSLDYGALGAYSKSNELYAVWENDKFKSDKWLEAFNTL